MITKEQFEIAIRIDDTASIYGIEREKAFTFFELCNNDITYFEEVITNMFEGSVPQNATELIISNYFGFEN